MKNLKYNIIEIFARVWAIWGLITFVVTFLIFFLPSMLSHFFPEKKGQTLFILVSRVWIRCWLFLIGCSLKVKGKQNFNPNETYIVTLNHNTLLDVPITCPFIPGANKTIGKSSFAKVPIFGFFYKRGGIMVDRNSTKSKAESYTKMKQVLAQKMIMCIFPEGTRNKTNQPLKAFYDGAFKLATETQTPIIPALLFKTNKAQPNNKTMYLLPTKLEMHFLEPIATTDISIKELNNKVFEIMLNYYSKNAVL